MYIQKSNKNNNNSLNVILGIIFLSIAFFVFPNFSYAQQSTTATYLLGGPDTSQYNRNIGQYKQLTNAGSRTSTFYSTRFSNGTDKNVVLNDMKAFINNNPSDSYMFIYGVHGQIGTDKQYTNGPLSKADFAYAVARALKETNTYGGLIMNCCGAGAIFDWTDKNFNSDDWSNLKYGISSSVANASGTTPDVGNKLMEEIFVPASDTNGDGVISAGELVTALEKTGDKNKDWRVEDPNQPVFELAPGAMKKYIIENYGFCGVVTPGEDDFGKPNQAYVFGDDLVCEYKDGSGCKERLDINGKPGKFEEYPLNYQLRTFAGGGLGHLRYRIEGKLSKYEEKPHTGKAKEPMKSNYEILLETIDSKLKERRVDWLSGGVDKSLTEDQVKESLADTLHAYSVNGAKVKPGMYLKRTVVTDAGGKSVRVSDIEEGGKRVCKFTEAPKQLQPSPQPFGQDPPGGGGSPPGGGGSPGGGSGSQNQPTPQPTPQPYNQQVVCPTVYEPVCGVNGKNYPNRCIAEQQQGITVAHEKVCTVEEEQAGKEGILANISDLLKQALTANIPEALLQAVIRAIVQLMTSFMAEGGMGVR